MKKAIKTNYLLVENSFNLKQLMLLKLQYPQLSSKGQYKF